MLDCKLLSDIYLLNFLKKIYSLPTGKLYQKKEKKLENFPAGTS